MMLQRKLSVMLDAGEGFMNRIKNNQKKAGHPFGHPADHDLWPGVY